MTGQPTEAPRSRADSLTDTVLATMQTHHDALNTINTALAPEDLAPRIDLLAATFQVTKAGIDLALLAYADAQLKLTARQTDALERIATALEAQVA